MVQKVINIECEYSSKVLDIPFNEKTVVEFGDRVIFKDAEDREEYGVIKGVGTETRDKDKILFSSKILRKATANDIQRVDSFVEHGKNALAICKKLVLKYKLDMQVFSSAYSFDGNRVLFMFTSDDRVDFRDLVKDLAKALQKQIYLRQIGPRDKAKLVTGYGKCGRSLCCSTFLGKLESINMEMVRVQSLESKGSSKLSGACGKLLCCLKYEVEAYKELKKLLPEVSTFVRLKRGTGAPGREGKVIALDILNKKIKIYFPKEEEIGIVSADDIEKVMKRSEANKK